MLSSDMIDSIAKNCLDSYNDLPKTGKPTPDEWTVLSCVVQYDSVKEDLEVVSIGTGSKCIGASKMSSSGDILNDSHAEVLARRGFLLYLYENIEKAIEGKTSIFVEDRNKFKLSENISFIFYSSQLPCGDASIVPKNGEVEDYGDIMYGNKRKVKDSSNKESKKAKTVHVKDIHRTGAKCLLDAEQDLKKPGASYHLLGCVRTKPGRGDSTLSVSCSDKLARWVHLGIQGSLLGMLLNESIYIKHFVFGAEVPYSIETLNRALIHRNCALLPDKIPKFYQSTLAFPAKRNERNIRPAPSSIVWIKTTKPILDVAVQGRKLGTTKKLKSLSSSLCISKYNLYRKFIEILKKNDDIKMCVLSESNNLNISYNDMKRKNRYYQEKWEMVKETFFKKWPEKPDMWNFCVG